MNIGLVLDGIVAQSWPLVQVRRYCFYVDRRCSGFTDAENEIRWAQYKRQRREMRRKQEYDLYGRH